IVGEVLEGPAELGARAGVPWLAWTCGECRFCTSGRENLCPRARFTGRDVDGGFAELVVADARFCFALPERYHPAQAAPLLGAAGVGYLRVGLISMIPWGAAAIAMVPWSMHSDRTGERRRHSALGLGAAMVGLLLLALIGHDPSASIAALCLVTCGTLCWVVTFWSLPTAFLSGRA